MTIKFTGPEGKWEPVYIRLPKRIKGRWCWFTTVYKRERNKYVYPSCGYEYGDLVDVLEDFD